MAADMRSQLGGAPPSSLGGTQLKVLRAMQKKQGPTTGSVRLVFPIGFPARGLCPWVSAFVVVGISISRLGIPPYMALVTVPFPQCVSLGGHFHISPILQKSL